MNNIAFMPGCSLSSYSPHDVQLVLNYLNHNLDNISAIQKCCGMPTLVMGQTELFKKRFEDLLKDTAYLGINEIVTACQNCYMIFNKYSNLKTTSLWTLIPDIGLPEELKNKAKDSDVIFSIQDSCAARHCSNIHDGIRWILTELGYKYSESKYSRENAMCCGQGGMAAAVNPDLSNRIAKKAASQFNTDYIVSYCASCRSSMYEAGFESYHILDLIFGPVVYKDTKCPKDVLSNPVKAWENRFKTKLVIKNMKG